MSVINKIRNYDNGFKTQSFIGRHIEIEHSVFNTTLALSTKLIYAYLKSSMDKNTKKAAIAYKTLTDKSGYSDGKLRAAISTLESDNLISVKKLSKKNDNGGLTTFNVYTFSPGGNFERVTYDFLCNPLLDKKDKEFLLFLSFYLLPNDCIGSVNTPAYFSLIQKWSEHQTGSPLSKATIRRRLNSLKKKHLIKDHYSGNFDIRQKFWTGYKFDMQKIMFFGEEDEFQNTEQISAVEDIRNTEDNEITGHELTQTDNVTQNTNQQFEQNTPTETRFDTPSENSRLPDIKPKIPLVGSDISDIYEHGKRFQILENVEDEFIRQQIPEVQCLFLLIRDWNIYWEVDISELNFAQSDVDKAIELFSFYYSYDELLQKIQDIAEWTGVPTKALGFPYFRSALLNGF